MEEDEEEKEEEEKEEEEEEEEEGKKGEEGKEGKDDMEGMQERFIHFRNCKHRFSGTTPMHIREKSRVCSVDDS